jgi:DNA polymerase III subunit beta
VKFRCERDVLVEALGTAARAATSRANAMPVLSGVHLRASGERLVVTGTDLDMTIRATVPVTVVGEGAAVLPARLAADVARSLEPGSVEVEVDGEEARISSGRSQFALRLPPTDDFPKTPDVVGDAVTVSAPALAEALRQVVMAASKDDARLILTGVHMAAEAGGLRLVATDSYRLAIRDVADATMLSEGQQVLVPSRALRELVQFLGGDDVTVRLGEREVAFDTTTGEHSSIEVRTRLIEGNFPEYRKLIPASYPNRLTVGRDALLDAVKRVKLVATDNTPVRISQGTDVVELRAVRQEVGIATETIDAAYEGSELTVAFNPDYLIEGVEAAPGDEVTLETLDGQKPAVLRATTGADYLYLLMPVRVS